jgi:hypothetical protein
LVESVKNWRSKWFYAGNMHLPLEVHSNDALVHNTRWDKEVLSATEIEGIRLFLNQIKAMKDA